MATRFYLPVSPAAGVAPALSAEWEHQNTDRRRMSPVKAATAITGLTYTPDGADDLTDKDALFAQFVSDPLEAQTIGIQTVTLTAACLEANAANNLFLTWKLFLCNNSGGSIGSTLVAIRRDGVEVGTALATRTDAATSSSVTPSAGDRLVLEVGLAGLCAAAAATQGHNGTINFGDAGASDLAASDGGGTPATDNPWLELATTTLLFQDTPELRGRPGGSHGQSQMQQVLAQ